MNREEGMRQLAACRDRIDDVDRRLIALLNERTCIVDEIGQLKRKLQLPIYEPRREDEVYRNVVKSNSGPLSPEALKRVFERIIDEMRTVQREKMLKEDAQAGTPTD
ncbi:MAG: chorismate mutase [Bryobacteraceae bacterium]|nr:chorismate mutase [Bryobacterales bacterium]MEB2364333.1 chorismate mutase [Bryobacterales bacterium]NUN03322.1 chorismate mutase [Bryobacteraceae bacterium]